ncbi:MULTISPECIES: cytochrome P450 [Amycolatopsis]|uniref:cytochrome P450 n=1 Tax=Amycolatopsis TaxID=1813 RepID=UPI0033B6EC6F
MNAPQYDGDLFSEQGILEPYERYREIRDLGPAVWLPGLDVFAIARYDDVRAVLGDHETFVSSHGVMLNDQSNELSRGTTLASDPPLHEHLRQVVAHRLTPRALRDQRDDIDSRAATVVAAVLAQADDVVDAVPVIAEAMPLAVVPDFLGFPDECRPHLLGWAKSGADLGGPISERTPAAAEHAMELVQYVRKLVENRGLLKDSLGDDLLQAADRGEVEWQQCPALLLDYFGPSLETTVSAIGSAIALFARHPDQWELLRDRPDLMGGAFNEVVRLESPIRGFTRVAVRDTDVGGVRVPAGARVFVLFGSANRDERKWDNADEFDISRDNADHVAMGHGVHGCAGQGLARLEFSSLMTRLAQVVTRFELVGEPKLLLNSMTRAYESLPVRVHTAAVAD